MVLKQRNRKIREGGVIVSVKLLDYIQLDTIESLLNGESPQRKITIIKNNNRLVLIDNKGREVVFVCTEDIDVNIAIDFISQMCSAFEIETEVKFKGE